MESHIFLTFLFFSPYFPPFVYCIAIPFSGYENGHSLLRQIYRDRNVNDNAFLICIDM